MHRRAMRQMGICMAAAGQGAVMPSRDIPRFERASVFLSWWFIGTVWRLTQSRPAKPDRQRRSRRPPDRTDARSRPGRGIPGWAPWSACAHKAVWRYVAFDVSMRSVRARPSAFRSGANRGYRTRSLVGAMMLSMRSSIVCCRTVLNLARGSMSWKTVSKAAASREVAA